MSFASAFGTQAAASVATADETTAPLTAGAASSTTFATTAATKTSTPFAAPSPFGRGASSASSAFKASVAAALSPSPSSAAPSTPSVFAQAVAAAVPAPPAAIDASPFTTTTAFAHPSSSQAPADSSKRAAAAPTAPPAPPASSSVFSTAETAGGATTAPPPVGAQAFGGSILRRPPTALTDATDNNSVAGGGSVFGAHRAPLPSASSAFVPTLLPPKETSPPPPPQQPPQQPQQTSQAQVGDTRPLPTVPRRGMSTAGGGMRSTAMLSAPPPPGAQPFDPLGDATRRTSFGRGGGGRGGGGGVGRGAPTASVTPALAAPPLPSAAAATANTPTTASPPPLPPPRSQVTQRGSTLPREDNSAATIPQKTPTGSTITVLYDKFLSRLLATSSDGAEREESTARMLDAAFFAMDWSSTPPDVLYELIAMTQTRKPRTMKLKLERWAVVFFLGCNVNGLLRRLHQGAGSGGPDDEASCGWQSILRIALTRVNILSDTFQELFVESRQQDGGASGGEQDRLMIPSMCVRLVLRRVRASFEIAASVGFHDIASLEAQLIGAIVRREGAGALFRKLDAAPPSKLHLIQAQTTACIICEYACLKSTTEMQRQLEFAKSFHEFCPDDVELRCTLYFRNALLILQALPLSMPHIAEARELLAHAMALCPREHSNARIVARWFAAAGFAVGMVPDMGDAACADGRGHNGGEPAEANVVGVPWLDTYGLGSELASMVLAMHTANLALYEETLSQQLPAYLETGIASLMQYGRCHMRTAVVLRYFVLMGHPSMLQLQGLVDFIGPLPFPHNALTATVDDFTKLWLMPLLLECMINGSVVGNVLILSKRRPFSLFDVEVQA